MKGLKLLCTAIVLSAAALHPCSAQQPAISYERSFERAVMAAHPVVVAKEKFSREDFFLYYPLADRSWHVNIARPDLPVYAPEGCEDIHYSVTDCIFPMVCGNRRYFSRQDPDGAGGFDIFYSTRRADGKWGEAVSLGYPYNSPGNDYLFIDTEDGKYSIFASDRECQGTDSVMVYVLECCHEPVRTRVSDAAELQRLCLLEPSMDLKKVNYQQAMTAIAGDKDLDEIYATQIALVRSLRDSLSSRAGIPVDEERAAELNAHLRLAEDHLKKIEMQFLNADNLPDRTALEEEAAKEIIGLGKSYTFTRKSLGTAVNFVYLSSH